MAETTPVDLTVLAEGAYVTYGAMLHFKDGQGDPIPQYPDAPLEVRRAWGAVTAYIVAALAEHQGVAPTPEMTGVTVTPEASYSDGSASYMDEHESVPE